MAFMVGDCKRCGANTITFDLGGGAVQTRVINGQPVCELFVICRACNRTSIYAAGAKNPQHSISKDTIQSCLQSPINLSQFFEVHRVISAGDDFGLPAPGYLPEELLAVFNEGAACLAMNCYNASATMFRLCVDLATAPLLPSEDANPPLPNSKQRRDLGLRLRWLFDNGVLPESLRALAACIREDANDGAHKGTLQRDDAEDVADFTVTLLERLITEPEKLKQAEVRRSERRKPQGT